MTMKYDRLLRAMKYQGYSEKQIAEYLKLSERSFMRRMNGSVEWNVDEMFALGELLSLKSLDYYFFMRDAKITARQAKKNMLVMINGNMHACISPGDQLIIKELDICEIPDYSMIYAVIEGEEKIMMLKRSGGLEYLINPLKISENPNISSGDVLELSREKEQGRDIKILGILLSVKPKECTMTSFGKIMRMRDPEAYRID